jgi:hypothetical protein
MGYDRNSPTRGYPHAHASVGMAPGFEEAFEEFLELD